MTHSIARTCAAALIVMAMFVIDPATAQVGPGGALDVGRDCQTLRNCRFTAGGTFRGCVSSFSCRTCRIVKTRCELTGTAGNACQKLRCTWGG